MLAPPEIVLLILSIASAAVWIRRGTAVESRGESRAPDAVGSAAGDGRLPRLAVPLGLVDAVGFFCLWLVALQAASGWVADAEHRPAEVAWITGLASLAVAVVALWIWRSPYPDLVSWFGLDGERWPRLIVSSLRRWLMILPPLMLIHRELSEWVPYQHQTLEQLTRSRDPGVWIRLWFSAVVAAPVIEEFFFRGVLLQALINFRAKWGRDWTAVVWGAWLTDRRAERDAEIDQNATDLGRSNVRQPGFWIPIALSAALFGAVHIGQGLAPIPLFLLGIFLGVLALKSRSLWPCILVHALFNAYTMFWVNLGIFIDPTGG